MPKYIYIGADSETGEDRQGEIVAGSEPEARLLLNDQGVLVSTLGSLQPAKSSQLNHKLTIKSQAHN